MDLLLVARRLAQDTFLEIKGAYVRSCHIHEFRGRCLNRHVKCHLCRLNSHKCDIWKKRTITVPSHDCSIVDRISLWWYIWWVTSPEMPICLFATCYSPLSANGAELHQDQLPPLPKGLLSSPLLLRVLHLLLGGAEQVKGIHPVGPCDHLGLGFRAI